jgi:hypothetical protein
MAISDLLMSKEKRCYIRGGDAMRSLGRKVIIFNIFEMDLPQRGQLST